MSVKHCLLGSMLLVSVMCQTNVSDTEANTCRNVNYHVQSLHQTITPCDNRTGCGRKIQELKVRLASLQAKVQAIEKVANKTVSELNAVVENINSPRHVVTQCPRRYTARLRSSCYRFVTGKVGWTKALLSCKYDGSNLVSIESADEGSYLRTYINERPHLNNTAGFYTGGTDQVSEGVWIWAANGREITFLDWGKREPRSGNCIGLWKGVGFKWATYRCDYITGYICEKNIVS